ncbi:MAG: carboxypeptidase regulatory-like domain-containing protein [Flavobacterium sp.]|nr:carboxypeptidase regulatory-like domain-containing protein [Candidatus Neoflavobacterium equi]
MQQPIVLCFFLMLISGTSTAQTQIQGTVVDSFTNSSISGALVTLYREADNSVRAHTQTNASGTFSLGQKFGIGAYTLEIAKLNYEKKVQYIVVQTLEDNILNLTIKLTPQTAILKELTIQAKQAIVVKQDTIIYHVDLLKNTHDESLEEVMSHITGFSISSSGEIEVHGKPVQKVLVDNKEVSNFGAALLIKSLSPEQVDQIEVRFDEKDNKIKERLLSTERFVVLNISLKPDLKKTLFGKQLLHAGHQNQLKFGGLTNLFSLTDNRNIQGFAENNNFGNNNIQLSHIRNIGDEASAKIFDLPVDIDDIKKTKAYHDEFFGFDDFTSNDNAIIGLAVHVPLSKKTDLFMGSFNNYQNIKNQMERRQLDRDLLLNSFSQHNVGTEYHSKNKVQLKYTNKNLKFSSDLNSVHFSQETANRVDENTQTIDFLKKHRSNNFYVNNTLEMLWSEKFGFSASSSFWSEQFSVNSAMDRAADLIQEDLGILERFDQNNENRYTALNNLLTLSYRTNKYGTHRLGFTQERNALHNEKTSNSAWFNAPYQRYWNAKNQLQYGVVHFYQKWFLDVNLSYAFVNYPSFVDAEFMRSKKGFFQYKFKTTYDFDLFTNLSFSANSLVDAYPMEKMTLGYVMQDFQTLFISNQDIAPFYNSNYALTFTKVFDRSESLTIAYLRGISNNVNAPNFTGGFVVVTSNQLSGNYHLFSTKYVRKLKGIPLTLEVLPESLINSSEYISQEGVQSVTSYRFQGGIKLTYKPSSQITIHSHSKYTHILFKDSGLPDFQRSFGFLSNTLRTSLFFLDEKIKSQLDFRQVNFVQNATTFNMLHWQTTYKTNNYRCFLQFNNIFNSERFITEDMNFNIVNVQDHQVFGRFVNLGFEFKIN